MKILSAQTLFLIAACLTLAACNQPMSYSVASQNEPYRSLEESDRRWLYNHHQTAAGAGTWVEDEIHLLDDTIDNIWSTSDGMMELETADKKSFSISHAKVISMVKAQGGAAVARDLVEQAHKSFGGSPKPPQVPYILLGLSEDTRRGQKLRYPKLYEEAMIAGTQKIVKLAQDLKQAGKLPQAIETMGEAIKQRKAELGADHPATKGAMQLYQAMAGRPYVDPPESNP